MSALPMRDRLALWLAIGVPAALLVGALGSQYIGGLAPCEMCYWQRWPHWAGLGFGLLAALLIRGGSHGLMRACLAFSAIAIGVSGAIGGFHAGVEYGWWEGLTSCSTSALSPGVDPLDAIMNAPVVRCDTAQWALWGISLAGWNFLFSTAAALTIALLIPRRPIIDMAVETADNTAAVLQ